LCAAIPPLVANENFVTTLLIPFLLLEADRLAWVLLLF